MEFIDEVCDKYGYDEEIKIAISKIFPVMVEQYGENRKSDIIEMFNDVRIFKSKDMSKSTQSKIEDIMTSNINKNVNFIDENPYEDDNEPGSYYSSLPIFNENLESTETRKWIVIKDMEGTIYGNEYKNTFGTYINIPYFIHELGHAFAMNKSKAVISGNTLHLKRGMFETISEVQNMDDKVNIIEKENKYIIIEEMLNEKETQDMLCKYMGLESYVEVNSRLNQIKHVGTSYSPVLISLANKMEEVIGREDLLSLRVDNNMKIKENFKQMAKKSQIYKKYLNNKDAFEYLDEKIFELFKLKLSCYKMSVDQYKEQTSRKMVDAFASLCAYEESINPEKMNEPKYTNIRNNILEQYEKNTLKEVLKTQIKDDIDISTNSSSDSLELKKENMVK